MAAEGTGLAVAIGGGMVIFVAQYPLAVGLQMELSIDWPARLMGRTPLQLHMQGAVRKSEGRFTLMAFKSYVFKIKPLPRLLPVAVCALSQPGWSASAV